jgi:hypothetical protein
VRQHGQDPSGLAIDLASRKHRYPLIGHCDRGRSIDRHMKSDQQQYNGQARDDDDAEEDEGQGDRDGEYHHQNCDSSSWIGADNANAIPVGIHSRVQELLALLEPL